MPISSESAQRAAVAAAGESQAWSRVAALAATILPAQPSPTEADLVIFHNPGPDVDGRARKWGHHLPDHSLMSLTVFAGALAKAEEGARRQGAADVATRAYADRRHLIGDRIIHWAVPWMIEVARWFPEHGPAAESASQLILELGDRLRPVPDLSAGEGLFPPGEDSYGPIVVDVPLDDLVASLWSGVAPVSGSAGAVDQRRFDEAAATWRLLAFDHEGTGRLWLDLAARAERTSALIGTAGNA